MNRLILTFLLLDSAIARADITDPVATLKASEHLTAGTFIFEWKADVSGNGKKEIFLDTDKDFYRKVKLGENIPAWDVYIPNSENSGYNVSRGIDIPDLGGIGPDYPQINVEKVYIGPISQLGKSGLVTIQTDYPRNLPAVAYIRAYTIEGDHLRETLLAQYDPTKGSNPVHEQYLSESHRTKVKLEKITVQ